MPDQVLSVGSDRPLVQLQWGLRIIGAGWALFFAGLLLNTLADLFDHDSWLGQRVMWGHGGDEYLLMLAAVNIVLGVFLYRSAAEPLANRTFIDFAVIANAAHLGLMLPMAIADPFDDAKLTGDVPAGILGTLVLAVLWLRVRPRASPASLAGDRELSLEGR